MAVGLWLGIAEVGWTLLWRVRLRSPGPVRARTGFLRSDRLLHRHAAGPLELAGLVALVLPRLFDGTARSWGRRVGRPLEDVAALEARTAALLTRVRAGARCRGIEVRPLELCGGLGVGVPAMRTGVRDGVRPDGRGGTEIGALELCGGLGVGQLALRTGVRDRIELRGGIDVRMTAWGVRAGRDVGTRGNPRRDVPTALRSLLASLALAASGRGPFLDPARARTLRLLCG
jgi:hypothetical protein